MSQYLRDVSSARSGGTMSVVSVGDSIDHSQVYNSSHPMYIDYTNHLREKLSAIIARESEKAAKAQQAVCTVIVDVETKNEVVREYPEMRIVWPQWRMPVHASWVARRELVNQYMLHHLRSYATTTVHYGGSALAALTFGDRDVRLRTDTASAVAVNEAFEDDVMCTKLCASAGSASSVLGWHTEPAMLRDYAAGEILRREAASSGMDFDADAIVVDGSVSFMSPLQFATAMLQHRASVGMYAFPYHPSMLVHQFGELYGTGVHYALDEGTLRLQYPESVAGVTSIDAVNWHGWLVNTIRSIAALENVSFQYELLGNRGPFMLVRVVRIDAPPPENTTFVHSLQLRGMEELTLVRTWRLKNLAVEPCDINSWEQIEITVPTRVVEKTCDYAMSLSADQFSRHAIRKRLSVVNDRVVVQGTSVVVNDALTCEHLDHLETAIFAHCFVARYETFRLASNLRKMVDEIAGFGSLGLIARMGHVLVAFASLAVDWTLGVVDQKLRGVFDRIRKWWRSAFEMQHRPTFELAPTFIRYETLVNAKAHDVVQAVGCGISQVFSAVSAAPSMPGFKYAAALGVVQDIAAASVPLIDVASVVVRDRTHLFADIVNTAGEGVSSADGDALLGKMQELNEFDQPSIGRHFLYNVTHESALGVEESAYDDYQYDSGYIATLDDFHDAVFPGMRNTDYKNDPSSISINPQDRSLAAEMMVLPLDFGEVPKPMDVFVSKLQAYNVTKRPITMQETLSAFHGRNLSAPVLALPQHEEQLLQQIWDDFLDVACLPEARAMLLQYQSDPVALEESSVKDWMAKAKPDNLVKVFKYFVENPEAWEEMRIGRYESMIKTDVKVPLSDKPLNNRVEPQVIVHHITAINAIFSAVFRTLVRRFLSLLKPNFMVNLLKDMPEVRDMMQAHHDWSVPLKYLENDFSKYDKSQGRFVWLIEQFVFGQLGMNQRMLEAWGLGHVDCSIRSVAVGISLSVRYQRKSGDATTSFGNVLVNILSVIHAYKGADIVWAVFVGDDSLIAARSLCAGDVAIRILAEKFNLQAKFFVSDAPYFASNFVLVYSDQRRIVVVPDPLKRVEKWSMAVSAYEPKWEERYISAENSLRIYRNRANLIGLPGAMYTRYGVHDRINFETIGDGIASAIRTLADFRAMWDEKSTRIIF